LAFNDVIMLALSVEQRSIHTFFLDVTYGRMAASKKICDEYGRTLMETGKGHNPLKTLREGGTFAQYVGAKERHEFRQRRTTLVLAPFGLAPFVLTPFITGHKHEPNGSTISSALSICKLLNILHENV
nr:hypothetical protein [Tanacetum cinerariifolium]